MRRNLEHLRDLDNASSKLMEDWRDRQDGCLKGVEETLLRVYRGEAAAAAAGSSPSGDTAAAVGEHQENKRGTKRKHAEKSPESCSSKSPEKKVACVKCRAKKVRCDGRQPYCLLRSKKSPVGEGADKRQQVEDAQKIDPALQLSPKQVSALLQKRGPPTNDEIKNALNTHNPQYNSQREEITSMYHELQQYSKEKINTANQLKKMVDMVLGRLNRDMEKFEKELGIEPESKSAPVAGGNIMVGGGSLGMPGHHHVHHHHSHAAMMGPGSHFAQGNSSMVASMTQQARVSSAPVASSASNNTLRCSSSTASAIQPPPAPTTMQHQALPYPSMRGTVPPPPMAVQSANLAAIKVDNSSPDWILAKILSYDKSKKIYTLSDEDLQSNQVYTIPEKQVVALKGTEKNKWARGDVVYAVYPDTTSFYHATVSTPPYNGFVMVHFKDDWDVNGVTHEKAVLMQHVMKVPPGCK